MKARGPDSRIEEEAAHWLARRDAGWDAACEESFCRWCAADPRHRAAVAELEAAWTTLDRPRDHNRTGALRAVLQVRARRRRRRVVFGGVAGAILAASLALMLAPGTPLPRPAAPLVSARALLPETRTLSDGSDVDFLPGSTIEVDFGGEFRRVRLAAGEAHFSVAKDPSRPFVVSVGGIEVRAVGTAFVVRLNADEVEVVVTEGRVALTKPGQGDGGRPAIVALDAGRRAVVPRASSAAPVVSDAEAGMLATRLTWRQPRLEFSDTTVAEAAALFNRTNGGRLRIADRDVAARRITGVFRADNLDGFVALLESTMGVRAERSADGAVELHAAR